MQARAQAAAAGPSQSITESPRHPHPKPSQPSVNMPVSARLIARRQQQAHRGPRFHPPSPQRPPTPNTPAFASLSIPGSGLPQTLRKNHVCFVLIELRPTGSLPSGASEGQVWLSTPRGSLSITQALTPLRNSSVLRAFLRALLNRETGHKQGAYAQRPRKLETADVSLKGNWLSWTGRAEEIIWRHDLSYGYGAIYTCHGKNRDKCDEPITNCHVIKKQP